MKLRFLIAVAMLCATSLAQVPVAPIVQPHVTFVDASGNPCASCTLSSFVAGTSTPLATYTDSTGTSQNTNPIVLDASGGANIWLNKLLSYKFVLKNPLGSTIWTVDQVSGGQMAAGPNGSIQFNNNGVAGGSSSLITDGNGGITQAIGSSLNPVTGKNFSNPPNSWTMWNNSALATTGVVYPPTGKTAEGDPHVTPFINLDVEDTSPNSTAPLYERIFCNHSSGGVTGPCVGQYTIVDNTSIDDHYGVWGYNAVVSQASANPNLLMFGIETNLFNNTGGDSLLLSNGQYNNRGPFFGIASTANGNNKSVAGFEVGDASSLTGQGGAGFQFGLFVDRATESAVQIGIPGLGLGDITLSLTQVAVSGGNAIYTYAANQPQPPIAAMEYISGFTNSGNNVFCQVTASTLTTFTCAATTQVNETHAALSFGGSAPLGLRLEAQGTAQSAVSQQNYPSLIMQLNANVLHNPGPTSVGRSFTQRLQPRTGADPITCWQTNFDTSDEFSTCSDGSVFAPGPILSIGSSNIAQIVSGTTVMQAQSNGITRVESMSTGIQAVFNLGSGTNFVHTTAYYFVDDNANIAKLASGSATPLLLGTSDAERMRITSGGDILIGTTTDCAQLLCVNSGITESSSILMTTTTSFSNGAAAASGTLTNAPAAGNPTKWIPINDNGTTRYIPAW